ncbi:MAG: restriction endonuclease [Litorilinea sp.]
MAQRTYHFRPPLWRPRTHLHAQTGVLVIGSVVWVCLFGLLGRQIWLGALPPERLVTLTFVVTLVWSVGMGLAWQHMVRRWRHTATHKLWPALNLEKTRALSPNDFEAYVGYRLFMRQGYAVENLPAVKDGGIDLIVTDPGGRRAIVQCKRYRGTVGEATLRDLYGTMVHDGASMAFLVTTGTISAAARRWSAGKPLALIDGARLVELAHAEPGGR